MTRIRDDGFAMVMAVVAAGLFAYLAMLFLQCERGDLIGMQARMQRVRLANAADAGVMVAMHGLGVTDRTRRWTADGQSHVMMFDGVSLAVTVEDERGKMAINRVDQEKLRRLLGVVGVPETDLDHLTDSILDWLDSDDAARPNGAEARQYRAAKSDVIPRNGKIRTIEELAGVQGMTPDLLARLAPAISIHFGDYGAFNERHANPLALMAMRGGGEGFSRASGGHVTALDIAEDTTLEGKPVMIKVVARLSDAAILERRVVAELTHSPSNPVWIREYR